MTYQLAVLGDPIAHSLSPQIHAQFAAQTGISAQYEKRHVVAEDFDQVVKTFFAEGGKGLNITVPHKQRAFELASSCSHAANLARAVNTLLINESGELYGENTDGYGLLRDLQHNLHWQIENARILMLGAGGAAAGVIADLLGAEPKSICIANRTVERAMDIVTRHQDERLSALSLTELVGSEAFDLVISANSAGLQESGSGSAEAFLPTSLKHSETCCYDMIYGKATPLLNWAADLPRAQSTGGLGMLVEQAARSFELWFGVKLDTKPVIKQISAWLEGQANSR
ncbi:MAG: shikimate dehydrogenase [Pseudomonadales bacterium]